MSEEKELSAGEILEAKKKSFNEDPDRFVDSKKLIMGVKRADNNGIEVYIDPHATVRELFIAQGEVLYNVQKHLTARDVMAYHKAQQGKKIVTGLNANLRAGINKVLKH